MNLKQFSTILTIAAVATFSISASGQRYNALPIDSDVRIGSLPNGLTYYIRHNENPKNQADFFIAMNVGSVQEEEHQRGLAHFLEHMCFNGTRHFPGHSLIDYLQGIGVKFGANLNAYTSTDETVYNICSVPLTRTAITDSCLLILRDWSHDLLLDGDEIDAERGVIKGEWRQRNSNANSRMLERALPTLYPGSPYGHRMPIGLMSVVETFPHKSLHDYYRTWYHPLNQCIVVTGDIDADSVEQKIQKLWSDVETPQGATRATAPIVPANESIIVSLISDPELSAPSLQFYLKHDDSLANRRPTILNLRRSTVASLVGSMLAERFDVIENDTLSPLLNVALGDTRYLLSRRQRAFTMRSPIKSMRAADAVRTLATELNRAATHGFLPAELQRAKISERAQADKAFATRSSVTNTDYARRYVRHFLDGGELLSATQRHKMMQGVIAGVTLDDVNNYIRSIVDRSGRNAAINAYLPMADSAATAATELAQVYLTALNAPVAPPTDLTISGSILPSSPVAGHITARDSVSALDASLITLSNGVRVYLHHSNSTPGQILIQGFSPGGFSQHYDPRKAALYHMTNDVLASCAYGPYTAVELRRLLAGINARVTIGIDKMEENIAISTDSASLAKALEVMYLKATSARCDNNAFTNLLERTRSRLSGHDANPTFAMGDSIHAYVYDRHPLGAKLSHADLDSVNVNEIFELYADRFADFSDFTFFIAGDFNTDTIEPLIERYIASLPSAGRVEYPADIGYHYATGRRDHHFTMPMLTPQAITYSFYNHPCDYNLENVVKAHALGQILQNRMRNEIREKRGWTYGVKTHIGIGAGMNGNDGANMIMPVYIRVAPENIDSTFALVHDIVLSAADALTYTSEEIANVKEYMLKSYNDTSSDNAYRIVAMHMLDKFGTDMHNGYADHLAKVTPETLAEFARRFLLPAHRMTLSMSPSTPD